MRFLVVVNSKSTQSQQALEQIPVLEKAFGNKNVERFKLTKTDFVDNSNLRKKLTALPEDSHVVIIGGDGTINFVVSAVFEEKLEKQLVMLPLKGGNASDIAHMLHGHQADNLQAIIDDGEIVTAYALPIQVNGAQRQVLAYASFGALAYTMQELDGLARDGILSKIHKIAVVIEAGRSIFALLKTNRVSAIVNGTTKRIYDITYVNGSRMAKVYQTPNALTKPYVLRFEVCHKHPILLRHLVLLLRSYRQRPKASAADKLAFPSGIWMQIDGEVEKLPRNTTVETAKELRPYRVLRHSS
jgi:diacylglycerol kinase family enzyme